MKDFTRRTAFLKESVIADFLQREFYRPILTAAREASAEARATGRTGTVALNNLLGDAVSFSGDIVALASLAQRIRQSLEDYARRLVADAGREALAARVRDLTARHRTRREALERMVRELVVQAASEEPGPQEAMLQLADETRAEIAREETEFRALLAQSAGERLEAGIFVSYGAPAEIVRFEDPLFGPLRVAVAEKINESARGTARTAGVRDMVLARLERARPAGASLELPFQVLVDTPPAVTLPADRLVAAVERTGAGDAEATALLQVLVRTALQREHQGVGASLWNTGVAFSEDALEAYLDARGSDVAVVRRRVPVASLHEEIRTRFFFPHGELDLVATVQPSSREAAELFVFQGRVRLRGLEEGPGLGVHELIAPENPLFKLLEAHHLPAWAGASGRPPPAADTGTEPGLDDWG